MFEWSRSFVRVLCAILALALGAPVLAPEAGRPARQATCCCGTGACCAPSAPCCTQGGDRRAPESGAARPAEAPAPRTAAVGAAAAPVLALAGAAARPVLVFTASPAEGRLHLRQSVFRT